jgi:ankyrin repeat protein
MAGDEEKKAMLLRLSLLNAHSFRRLYGYDDPDDKNSKSSLLEFLKKRKANNSSLQQDAETNAARIASWKRVEEQRFIQDVKHGYTLSIEFAIQSRIDVNAQDQFGMTALHYAAATGFRPCVRLLVNSGLCNYLLKDNKGRLASELAYEWGKDYAVGLLLQKKEVRQAYEESLTPSPGAPSDDI